MASAPLVTVAAASKGRDKGRTGMAAIIAQAVRRAAAGGRMMVSLMQAADP